MQLVSSLVIGITGELKVFCYPFDINPDLHVRFTVDDERGEKLRLYGVTRRMMAVYLCIASNDVPPIVSKRVILKVNCKDMAHILSLSDKYLIILFR